MDCQDYLDQRVIKVKLQLFLHNQAYQAQEATKAKEVSKATREVLVKQADQVKKVKRVLQDLMVLKYESNLHLFLTTY
jgi:hypothetical protein